MPCVPGHVADAGGVIEGRLVRRAALLAAEGDRWRALSAVPPKCVHRSAERAGTAPWGDGGFVIEFGGVCNQDTYPMYLACILHVFCMYLDVIRSYTVFPPH